jgi:HK97 gp10 family phage protein
MSKSDMGVSDLKKQLQGMERKLQRQTLRKAIRAAGKIVAAQIRAESPSDKGILKRSVKVKSAKRIKNRIGVDVSVEGGHDEGFVGFVEFGRKGQLANPFIRRSVDSKRQGVIDEVEVSVRKAFESGR